MNPVAFYGFSAVAVAAALLMVLARSALHAVLWLVVCFGALAGLFAGLDAHFLAAVQVLVYAGAILVLFLFVIMLLNLRPEDVQRAPSISLHGGLGGLFVGVGGFLLLVVFFAMAVPGFTKRWPEPNPSPGGAMEVARQLFSEHLLPFEVASLLLLAAIVGAVALTKKRLP